MPPDSGPVAATGNGGGLPVLASEQRFLLDVAMRLGVPAFVLYIVLAQLGPKIDHGIAVADRVDAELQVVIERGCGPLPTPVETLHATGARFPLLYLDSGAGAR